MCRGHISLLMTTAYIHIFILFQYCLPMLMEKLSSELQSAKLDTYQTLIACTPVYGAKHIKEYMEAIWAYCRKEVCLVVADSVSCKF